MAVLSATELVNLRREWVRAKTDAVATFGPSVTKSELNDMMQAIEDWLEGERTALSTAINTATSPITFDNDDKKKAFAVWCRQKFGRDRL